MSRLPTRSGAGAGSSTHGHLPGIAFVLAGVLILTSALFPRADDPADYAAFLALLAEHPARTRAVLLAVPTGIWALAAGVVALQSLVGQAAARLWLRLGAAAVVIGAATVTVQFALGGAALALHLDGSTGGSALWAAGTYTRSFGMLILWTGLAAVGHALATLGLVSRWLALAPIVLGVAMAAVSAAAILVGPTSVLALSTGGLAALTALWSAAFGLILMRG